MAFAGAPITPTDGTLVISDGAGSPLTCTIQYEDGNFSLTGMNQGAMDTVVFMDRGRPYAIRKEKNRPIPFSFTAHALSMVGDPGSACFKKGTWASATSTLPTANGGSEVFCVKLVYTAERTDFGASTDSTATFLICRITDVDFAEGMPSTFTIKGEAYVFSDSDIVLAA